MAGPAGEGALQAAKASGGKVNAIWVDTDGCVSAESYCPNIISSVYKGLDVAVKDAITAAKDGSFSQEPYVGTLENEGTGLSPFNEFDGKVPGRAQDRARHPEGGHHRRQDQDRVQVPAPGIVTDDGTSPQTEAGTGLRLRGITKRFGSLVANDASTWTSFPARSTVCSGRTGPASRP